MDRNQFRQGVDSGTRSEDENDFEPSLPARLPNDFSFENYLNGLEETDPFDPAQTDPNGSADTDLTESRETNVSNLQNPNLSNSAQPSFDIAHSHPIHSTQENQHTFQQGVSTNTAQGNLDAFEDPNLLSSAQTNSYNFEDQSSEQTEFFNNPTDTNLVHSVQGTFSGFEQLQVVNEAQGNLSAFEQRRLLNTAQNNSLTSFEQLYLSDSARRNVSSFAQTHRFNSMQTHPATFRGRAFRNAAQATFHQDPNPTSSAPTNLTGLRRSNLADSQEPNLINPAEPRLIRDRRTTSINSVGTNLPSFINPNLSRRSQSTTDAMEVDDSGVVDVRDRAITYAWQFLNDYPRRSVQNCYRLIVRSYLGQALTASVLGLVTRTGFDIDITRRILRDIQTPEFLTVQLLDGIQELGEYIASHPGEVAEIWRQEASDLRVTLDEPHITGNAGALETRLGTRDWRRNWVHHPGEAWETAAEVSDALNAADESIDEDDTTSAPVGSNGRLRVHHLDNGITRWSVVVNDQWTTAGEYTPGVGRPWRCLICRRGEQFSANDKGALKVHLCSRHDVDRDDLVGVQAEEVFPNHEGWDNRDVFAWGEYVNGDPLPWKCCLCERHKGVKHGDGSFARHFKLTHGIKVNVPSRWTRPHMDPARVAARVARAATKRAAKRTATEAGLDDDEEEEENNEDE